MLEVTGQPLPVALVEAGAALQDHPALGAPAQPVVRAGLAGRVITALAERGVQAAVLVALDQK